MWTSAYVDGLASWIVGTLHWSFETERYSGKAGKQVKAIRLVTLRPETLRGATLIICLASAVTMYPRQFGIAPDDRYSLRYYGACNTFTHTIIR